MKPLFVLIHSPLVGPLTWQAVGEALQRRGEAVVLPVLTDQATSDQPFWQQHALAVALALSTQPDVPLVLVAHSGAGLLLPVIRQGVPNPVVAYIFVDAGLPSTASRLELMHREDAAWASDFAAYLRAGNRFPTWTEEDLQDIVPDEATRRQLVAELQPRDLAFFSETLPVFADWPDAACAYIQFSAAYAIHAQRAKAAGWPVYHQSAGHFHMVVDPAWVTEKLLVIIQTRQTNY